MDINVIGPLRVKLFPIGCIGLSFIYYKHKHPFQAFHQNNVGDHDNARSLGIAALVCNILTIVMHTLLVVACVITLIAAISTAANREDDDDYDDDCTQVYDYRYNQYVTRCY